MIVCVDSTQQRKTPQPIPTSSSVKVGQVIALQGVEYEVSDIKDVTCVGSQGELSVKSLMGRKSLSVDLRGAGQRFANIDYCQDGDRIFLGSYCEVDSLRLSNLRELDGW